MTNGENLMAWVLENEPLMARVFSAAAICYLVVRVCYGQITKRAGGTAEQNELFKFLLDTLNSSNGWTRPDEQNIKLIPMGKPSIKVSWVVIDPSGKKLTGIWIGTDAVHGNGRLTKSQIKTLSAKAKKIADELDARARAGDINRLLASVK